MTAAPTPSAEELDALDRQLRGIDPVKSWAEADVAMAKAADALKALRQQVADKDARIHELESAVLAYNDILRSCFSVAARNGKDTNWIGFAAKIHDALCQHHLTWRSCTDYGKGETVTMSEHSGDTVNPPFAGIAWLIETNDPIGNVLYYCGQGDWCCNPNHAMKWPSKEAAEKSESWTQIQYPGNMRIAEHEWVAR